MTVSAPRWGDSILERELSRAIGIFTRQRMEEPLDAYLEAYEEVRLAVEDVLERSVDLTRFTETSVEILCDPHGFEVARYLSGPPISTDDLRVLAETSVAPTVLRSDATKAVRVAETILLGLDRARFPWVSEQREPTSSEREAAVVATASAIAHRRVLTGRANESKEEQEMAVCTFLESSCGFVKVPPREIRTYGDAPARGEFCREALFGTRKADIIATLWDGRVMPIECKVSNSSTNSIKRLNNDAAVKAKSWLHEFGSNGTVPAATLSGVFKLRNLKSAQEDGLTLWWAHDLEPLMAFIDATR